MSSTQLSFTLSTSSKVKTVHLLGSWDNYNGQVPLSKDSSKAGKWKGTFRFGHTTLKPGKRYWYYYIIDGYHISHDPSISSTKEPTTGRLLNILDVPKTSSSSSSYGTAKSSTEIVKGRSISPSKIVCPKPSKPYASRAVREADYSRSPVASLSADLEKYSLKYSPRDISPPSSIGSSLSSRSSGFGDHRSSPSSLSSLSDPNSSSSGGSKCSCNRWGVTRRGDKVRLDCGGSRCGYSDDSSNCSSIDTSSASEESSESEEEIATTSRRRPQVQTSKAPPPSSKRDKYVEMKPRSGGSSKQKVTVSHGGRRR